MLRTVASKVAWVGRTASMVFGLALVMALVLGAATTAMSATGGNFLLGKSNVADRVSTLVKRGPGPALRLDVQEGQPPMRVDSSGKVENLNADKVDGLDSEQLKGQTGPAGAQGEQGLQGEQGIQGEPGPQGRTGSSGATTVRTVSHQSGTVVPGSSISQVVAACSSNEKATGGGYSTNTPANIAVFQSQPTNTFSGPGWAVGFRNNDNISRSITVYVICASP